MKTVFLFDIDGTLTWPRRPMDDQTADILRRLAGGAAVALVTGSDVAKVRQQVPAKIISIAYGIFTCSGSEFWQQDRLVHATGHDFPDDLLRYAAGLLASSHYPVRTGLHVESRTGALNISVVGRNADPDQRTAYAHYDRKTGERREIAAEIMRRFPGYEARRGGQISIDISPRGWNKGRVVAELETRLGPCAIRFFGDNLGPNGNDEPVAHRLQEGGSRHAVHAVTSPDDTIRLLKVHYAEFLQLPVGSANSLDAPHP